MHVTAASLAAALLVSTTAAQAPEIATTVAFTEGPTVDRDGKVYFTELVWPADHELSRTACCRRYREKSNNANGLLIDPQGRLIACEGAERSGRA